jgi:Trypsin-co-occurring domain 1
MGEIVKYTSDHGDLLVEVNDDLEPELERVNLGDTAEKKLVEVTNSFEKAVEPILNASKVIQAQLCTMKPDKAEIQFGINLGGEFGVVTKVTGEANFSVTLTWEFEDDDKQ